MNNTDGIALIDKIYADLEKSQDVSSIIESLKELRPYALEEKDPTLTKTIRLTYEHLEENGSFDFEGPAEQLEEGEEADVTFEVIPAGVESLLYLVSLMKNAQNKMNREDLFHYRDSLLGA